MRGGCENRGHALISKEGMKTSQSFDTAAIVRPPQNAVALHGAWLVVLGFRLLFNAGEIRWTLCGPFLVFRVTRSKRCLPTSRATTGSSDSLSLDTSSTCTTA